MLSHSIFPLPRTVSAYWKPAEYTDWQVQCSRLAGLGLAVWQQVCLAPLSDYLPRKGMILDRLLACLFLRMTWLLINVMPQCFTVCLVSLKLSKLRNCQEWRIRIPMPTKASLCLPLQTRFSSLCLDPVLWPWARPFPVLGLKCHTSAAVLLFVSIFHPVLNLRSKKSAFLSALTMSYFILLNTGSLLFPSALCLASSCEDDSPGLPELVSKQMHSGLVCGILRLEASRQYSASLQTDGD